MIKQCDNDSSMGLGIHLYPQCFEGIAQFKCEVRYSEVEDDILYLCEACRDALRKGCKKHHYGFKSRRVKDG